MLSSRPNLDDFVDGAQPIFRLATDRRADGPRRELQSKTPCFNTHAEAHSRSRATRHGSFVALVVASLWRWSVALFDKHSGNVRSRKQGRRQPSLGSCLTESDHTRYARCCVPVLSCGGGTLNSGLIGQRVSWRTSISHRGPIKPP